MLGMLVLACADLAGLLRAADVAAAMSVEGLLGTDRPFAADLVALRPHPGQQASAANIAALLAGSAIVASHRTGDPRVQDAYSLRCAPQVHGAARDALAFAETCADRELASAIDNPVVLADGRVESVGNFHGAPLAHACDLLAIVVADVAAMSERRTDRFLDATRSHGLPPFLAARAGRRQRPDDRPVHGGRAGGRVPAAGRPGQRRHASRPRPCRRTTCRWAGRPPASCGRRSATWPRVLGGRAGRPRPRGIDLRAPLAPAPGDRRRRATPCGPAGWAGPGPDRLLAPELAAAARPRRRRRRRCAAAEREVGALA